MPFLFPIDAKILRKRFWFRETTPESQFGKQLWLEAWPISSKEAARFQRVEVILTSSNFVPLAMQITLPNGRERTVYLLEDFRINQAATVADHDFQPPTLAGWKRVFLNGSPPLQPKEPMLATPKITRRGSLSHTSPSISRCQNRSRVNRGGLLESRPVLPKFCHQGRVLCRSCCRCVRSCR
jgi:hypothetical protein